MYPPVSYNIGSRADPHRRIIPQKQVETKIKAVRNAHGLDVNMVLAEGFEPPTPSM